MERNIAFTVDTLDGRCRDRNSASLAERVAAEDDVLRVGSWRCDGVHDFSV